MVGGKRGKVGGGWFTFVLSSHITGGNKGEHLLDRPWSFGVPLAADDFPPPMPAGGCFGEHVACLGAHIGGEGPLAG